MDNQYKLHISKTHQFRQALLAITSFTLSYFAIYKFNSFNDEIRTFFAVILLFLGLFFCVDAFINKARITIDKNYLWLKKWIFISKKYQWKDINFFHPHINTFGFDNTLYNIKYHSVKNININKEHPTEIHIKKDLVRNISIRIWPFKTGNSYEGALSISNLLNFFKKQYDYVDIFTDEIKQEEAEKILEQFKGLGLHEVESKIDQTTSDFIFIMIVCTFMMASIIIIGTVFS